MAKVEQRHRKMAKLMFVEHESRGGLEPARLMSAIAIADTEAQIVAWLREHYFDTHSGMAEAIERGDWMDNAPR